MHKTTKGALAAAAAVALLTGGAGTLAFWTDGDTITTPDLTSGGLDIAVDACPDWTLDGDGGAGGLLGAREIVPGDTLTRTCTYDIVAEGDHFEATLDVDQDLLTLDDNGLEDELVLDTTFTLDGAPVGLPPVVAEPVAAGVPETFYDGTYTLTAVFTADFPYGVEDNDSQDLTVNLENIAVTLTQTDNHP
ncbi:alternate-type signal peptide domain-containing protein [Nocardioides sp.]|uniref:alternate-type signal peptide domain-containing protein n=1 Tax=Nocardioides sp. TaxID=35761 RepID=UPI00286C2311|nr:alternate-type signal peptide domain-containing protein [Nocardioides sp.]